MIEDASSAFGPDRPLQSGISFGLGMISAQHDPRDPRSDVELYADILDLCSFAESEGLDAVWLSEHHFVDDGYMPSLLPTAAAIAARTQRIAVATGVLLAPFYDPIRLAEDAATVDLISAGRLVLGLGAGYRAEEFAGFGRPQAGLGAALEMTIRTLREGWGGRRIESGSAPVFLTPRPARPAGPPVWLGSRSRAGVRRAARLADGLLAARVDAGEFAEQVALLDTELRAAQRDPREVAIGVHCPVFAWSDAVDAWTQVEAHLHFSEWKYADMIREPYGTRASAAAGTPPALTDETRARLRHDALVGTPAEVARAIAAYARGAGDHPFHFVARLYWPGMDPAVMRDAVRVYAREVVPAVRTEQGVRR